MNSRNHRILSALVLAALTGVRCLHAADPSEGSLPHYQPAQTLTGDMRTVAESSADPLMLGWIEGFKKYHANFKIIDKGTAPLACVPGVLCGGYDLGFPAREIWAFEEDLFHKIKGYGSFVIQVGLGAQKTTGLTPTLGVYVNAANPITRITLDQLDAIYSSERRRGFSKDVKVWGDLGVPGDWASHPVHPYSHRLPNGIDYFVQKVVTRGADFKKTTTELPMRGGSFGPDDIMAQAVVKDPDGIGLGCFGNVIPGMKTIALAEKEGAPFYTGTLEEVKSLKYPLHRPIYVVIDRAPGQPIDPRIKEFLRYVLSSEGQDVVAASGGWVPLPASVAAAQRKKLD